MRAVTLSACVASLVALSPSSSNAQVFQGRVTGQGQGEPVATALVKLVDEAGDELAITIADSAGLYRVEAEGPGVFRLVAERIGYRPFETPLLEAGITDGVYPIDIEMVPAPVELRGFTVMTDRVSEERADQTFRMITGLDPKSLRFRPLGFEALQDHLDRAHTLTDVIRWEYGGGAIQVFETRDGPCFEFRQRGCLPIFLNGFRLDAEFMPTLPLDMVYRLQVVVPSDGSVAYAHEGAVLLFTEGWLR